MTIANDTDAQSQASNQTVRWKQFLLLWFLFIAICFGLGYPILKRYDPRYTDGLSDASKYYAITTGKDTSVFKELFRGRVLVPFVARPFYWFAQRFLPNWNAGFFGLLIANALFCATSACLVVAIGNKLFDNIAVPLLGATLYLLNFNIPNLQLAGLIDSGEACFLAAVVLSLLLQRWYLLPIWAVIGALAKETFVPFSFLYASTWWLALWRKNKTGKAELIWVIVAFAIGLATVSLVHSKVAGTFRWPWQIAAQANAHVNFFVSLWRVLSDHSFWYVFVWLLPLGLWRLKYFPKSWLVAAAVTAIFGLILGAYNNTGGTVGRAVFNIIGPLLSLSVASLISKTNLSTSKALST
jgi:hypothetical protein